MRINSAKELKVYQKGYDLAMRVFRLSKTFPADHKELTLLSTEVGKMLGSMILTPEKFLLP